MENKSTTRKYSVTVKGEFPIIVKARTSKEAAKQVYQQYFQKISRNCNVKTPPFFHVEDSTEEMANTLCITEKGVKKFLIVSPYTQQEINEVFRSSYISIIKYLDKKYTTPDTDENYNYLESKKPEYAYGILREWLQSNIVYFVLVKKINLDKIKNDIHEIMTTVEMSYFLTDVDSVIEKAKLEIQYNNNLEYILSEIKRGTDLSKYFGYGLSRYMLQQLAKLHKARKFRSKIESHLENINFRKESSDFHNGRYDEYLSSDYVK